MQNTEENIKQYLQQLSAHCSSFSLDGLPAAGEFLYREIRLEDIYMPLRLSRAQETFDALQRESYMWNIADKTSRIQPDNKEIDEDSLKMINKSISQLENKEKAHNELKNEFRDLVAFLDQCLNSQGEKKDHFNQPEPAFSAAQELCSLDVRYDNKPVGPLLSDRPSRKIILSNPGGGKTTLSKRVALAYADQDVSFKESYDLPGSLFPVLLYCRTLGNLDLAQMNDFYTMTYSVTKKTLDHISFSKEEFSQILMNKAREGTLLLIVDGFDEIFDKDRLQEFSVLLSDYLTENEKVHLLLTSRMASFANSNRSEEAIIQRIKDIPHIKYNGIPELKKDEIIYFIRRWHDVLFPYDPERQAVADRIIGQLNSSAFSHLGGMIKVPLHLSNILMVTRISNSIPNDKCQLYNDYLTISLNWHARGTVHPKDTFHYLAYIASYMTKKGLQRISGNILTEVLKQCQTDLDGIFIMPLQENNFQDFIRELEERSCVLKKSFSHQDENFYQFTHLQLQEYLTAYAIMNGCSDEEDNNNYPVDILSAHFNQSAWREIILLASLMGDKRTSSSLVVKLLEEVKKSEDSHYATNLLFDMITNGISIKQEKKRDIYDLLFKNHITAYHLNRICEFMSDARSDTFVSYITAQFEDSLKTDNITHCFALSIITAYNFVNERENPLEKAEEMILNGDDSQLVIGIYIFVVLGWCKYCNIKTIFSKYDIRICPETLKRLHQMITAKQPLRIYETADFVYDSVLAGYTKGDSFFDRNLYEKLIHLLLQEDFTYSYEKILSVFPVNFYSLGLHADLPVEKLQKKYLEKYREELKDGSKAPDTVFTFSVCTILGCFDVVTDELLDEFLKLEGYCSIHKDEVDDAAREKLKLLQKQIYALTDPSTAGMNYYDMGDFENAKAAFMVAFEKGDTAISNNLAYMLRRGEISNVTYKEHTYSVKELLETGILNLEAFPIINYALYVASSKTPFSYQKGLEIVKTLKTDNTVQDEFNLLNACFWWAQTAKKNDAEGYIVISWLLELGLMDMELMRRFRLGTKEDVHKKLLEEFHIDPQL